jgi:hypothetical protein
LDEFHHRVLHGVESIVVVAQPESREFERAPLDAGEKLIEGSARHPVLVPNPPEAQIGWVNGRVINAGERNKRGHRVSNALPGAALTVAGTHCDSGNQELTNTPGEVASRIRNKTSSNASPFS